MVTNQSKDIYSVTLTLCDFVPVLNTLLHKSSDLPEFNQTHNAVFILVQTFALHVHNILF